MRCFDDSYCCDEQTQHGEHIRGIRGIAIALRYRKVALESMVDKNEALNSWLICLAIARVGARGLRMRARPVPSYASSVGRSAGRVVRPSVRLKGDKASVPSVRIRWGACCAGRP